MAKKNDAEMTIDRLIEEMDKKFGERSLVELDDGIVGQVEAISTGIDSLDYALGVGGFPRGRIVEIFGAEAGGKTTVAIMAMAKAQSMAGKMPIMLNPVPHVKPIMGRVGMLDVEHAFNPEYAKIHGLKLTKGSGFWFDQPTGGVEAMQKLEYMVNSNLFDIIVVDSVAGLTTLDDQKKDIGDKTIAGVAQLMSESLRKLTPLISKSRSVVIFINQIREKPAVLFGSPETTPGGRALKFYSSVRLRVSRGESISSGSQRIGHNMKISVVKNKVAPPFKKTDIDLYYEATDKNDAGFDTFGDMLKVSTECGVVQLSGSQYKFISRETGELHKANGKVKWREYLEEHQDVAEEIHIEVLNTLGGHGNERTEETQQEQ